MSKASKLARMKNTVLETTGLTYNPSGGTVELNFTPDVTAPGVSVPLVLAGNTDPGLCGATTTPPLLGYPYAHIRDSKPASVNSGTFYDVRNAVAYSNVKFPQATAAGLEMYYRSRDFTERYVDEIGVSMAPAPDEISGGTNDGGPGTFLNFPVGTYYIQCRAPCFSTLTSVIHLYNYTQAQNNDTSIGAYVYIEVYGSSSYAGNQTDSCLKGRFTVTDSNDQYLVIHAATDDQSTYGFGRGAFNDTFILNPDFIYAEFELWKIGYIYKFIKL